MEELTTILKTAFKIVMSYYILKYCLELLVHDICINIEIKEINLTTEMNHVTSVSETSVQIKSDNITIVFKFIDLYCISKRKMNRNVLYGVKNVVGDGEAIRSTHLAGIYKMKLKISNNWSFRYFHIQ